MTAARKAGHPPSDPAAAAPARRGDVPAAPSADTDCASASPAAAPPSLWPRRAAIAGVALAAAGAGVALGWRRLTLAPANGDALWPHTFPTPEGAPLALASLRGRALLVNFWATWCPPCVQELPMLSRFYADQTAKGGNAAWAAVGLAVDNAAAVRVFLARAPLSFPVAITGLDGVALTRELGNAAGGLPFTVLFGADGAVLERKLGQLAESELSAWRSRHG